MGSIRPFRFRAFGTVGVLRDQHIIYVFRANKLSFQTTVWSLGFGVSWSAVPEGGRRLRLSGFVAWLSCLEFGDSGFRV